MELFQLVLYFSSNNLLSDDQTDAFLKWIIEKKYVELLRTFLQYKNSTLCAFATRILESAVRIVEPEFVRLLLQFSVDPRNLSGHHGGNMLRRMLRGVLVGEVDIGWIRWKRIIKLAKILLESGADPDPVVDERFAPSPLSTAVVCNNKELVEILVRAGANVNNEADFFVANTPLAYAVESNELSMVNLLLELGAKIQAFYIDEILVLAWAAAERPQMCDILLSRTQSQPDNIDVPGIIYASRMGLNSLLTYLQGAKNLPETKVKKLLECALTTVIKCNFKDSRLLQVLLNAGVDPNVPTHAEECPLRHALDFRLTASGADVNSRVHDIVGNPTPLQWATMAYRTLVCTVVLSKLRSFW
jgi:ankyrin repeat protein